jgi:adenylate cyclase
LARRGPGDDHITKSLTQRARNVATIARAQFQRTLEGNFGPARPRPRAGPDRRRLAAIEEPPAAAYVNSRQPASPKDRQHAGRDLSPVAQRDSHDDVAAITDWIIAQGLRRAGLGRLLAGVCERLAALGVPIWRAFISAQTLHPRIAGLGCSWRPEEGIRTDVYVHRLTPSDAFLSSPFKRMLDLGLDDLRLRLDQAEPVEFPLLEEFRQQGATDYLAQRIGFGHDGARDERTGVIASWTTASSEGFSARDLSILRRLVPRLALALQARLNYDIAVNLLDAYVGPEAGRRILDGEIRRGSLEVISSVIAYADLRGFTALADRLPHDELVATLNAYFDCVVPAIGAHGGQVLKFLGDGLLATFPLAGRPPAEICAMALDAAIDVLACIADLNVARAQEGRETMLLDQVLHLGDVYWGNVGSAERLDFTVVGPAVNEAARIEALCAQYDRNLLISQAFAQAATSSSERLISIGRFALRGVRSVQSIYTLVDLPESAPSLRLGTAEP